MGIDTIINDGFGKVSEFATGVIFYSVDLGLVSSTGNPVMLPLILLWLALASVFFTIYLGFINFRYFGHAIAVLRGKHDDPNSEGQINRFQALATSLSGTVGLGNIAGVAVAVSVGGPGAVFWMVLMGFLGMSTKFVEVTLGVKYRAHADKEHPEVLSGGPMYYIKAAFDKRNMSKLGAIMAAMFAIFCVGGAIGGGNMFQANQAFNQFVIMTGGFEGVDPSWWADKGWLFGVMLAFLVGLVIIGGLKSIARVTSKLVPLMGGIYLLTGLIVIAMHYQNIGGALQIIFIDAFSLKAGFGGLLGGLLVGVQRASFSNEAGLGSAAIVHATAKTNKPISQGFVGMLGPFIDTVIICLVTALVIVVTGVYTEGNGVEGVMLTSRAMASGSHYFTYVLGVTVFLFAYSTLITWSYYGMKALGYLVGEHDRVNLVFKLLFCCFVVVGCSSELENVISFSDAMLFSMGIPNLIALYMFAPEIKRDLKSYLQGIKNK